MAVAGMANGIGKLKMAMLIFIVASVVGVIGSILSYSAESGALSTISAGYNMGAVFGTLLVSLAVAVIASIIALVGVFYMFGGFKLLKQVSARYNIGYIGSILYIVSEIGAVIFAVLALYFIYALSSSYAIAYQYAGLGTAVLGLTAIIGILAIIAVILIVISFWRIGAEYQNSIVQIGGILWVVLNIAAGLSSLLSVVSIIGPIILFIGFNQILNSPAPAQPKAKT